MTTGPSDSVSPNSDSDLKVRRSDDPAGTAAAPGWYADPDGSGVPRWWDGAAWTAHVAPGHDSPAGAGTAPPTPDSHYSVHGYSQLEHPHVVTSVVPPDDPKSVGIAFLLTLFFGPLGMFYSTVDGALIMTGALVVGAVVVGLVTLGVGLLIWGPLIWIISIIWGCAAASEKSRPHVVQNEI